MEIAATCHHGWTQTSEETCVRLYSNEKTWNQAQASCIGAGAKLLTMENRIKIYSKYTSSKDGFFLRGMFSFIVN